MSESISSLVPVLSSEIGGAPVQTVNARELHAWLESGQRFNDWIRKRINDYGFVEGQDYARIVLRPDQKLADAGGGIAGITAAQNNVALESTGYGDFGQQGRIEYAITLDMAKELSMVERNEKGKQARRYFIECEKRMKASPSALPDLRQTALEILKCELEIASLLKVPEHIGQVEALKSVHRETGLDYRPLLAHSKSQEAISPEDVMLEPAGLAKRLSIVDGAAVNRWLESLGLQRKEGKSWVPTDKGKPYCAMHHWTTAFKSGYNLKWSLAYVSSQLPPDWPR